MTHILIMYQLITQQNITYNSLPRTSTFSVRPTQLKSISILIKFVIQFITVSSVVVVVSLKPLKSTKLKIVVTVSFTSTADQVTTTVCSVANHSDPHY